MSKVLANIIREANEELDNEKLKKYDFSDGDGTLSNELLNVFLKRFIAVTPNLNNIRETKEQLNGLLKQYFSFHVAVSSNGDLIFLEYFNENNELKSLTI